MYLSSIIAAPLYGCGCNIYIVIPIPSVGILYFVIDRHTFLSTRGYTKLRGRWRIPSRSRRRRLAAIFVTFDSPCKHLSLPLSWSFTVWARELSRDSIWRFFRLRNFSISVPRVTNTVSRQISIIREENWEKF